MGRKLENVLKGFNPQKCLLLLKHTTPRITISRNRRNIAARQMREEIGQLLKSGQVTKVYDTKIDTLIKEENMVVAYDLLDHFCNSIISQFPVVEAQRYCPPDLKEPITTLIYAAPRCAELIELNQVRDILITKYGKEFAIAAEEKRADCGLNQQIIELLLLHPASEQAKVKKLREICSQHNLEWRPEWVPGGVLEIPDRARVDNRRTAKDEGSSKLQPAEGASSSMRPTNLVQNMKAQPHRGSRHGNGMKANVGVCENMDEPYRATSPRFGPKSKYSEKDELTRANMSLSERVNEPYPSEFGAKQSSIPKEELARGNMKAFEDANEPYERSPGFGTKNPKDEVIKANTRVSEEPYKPVYSSKPTSFSMANKYEDIDEPYNPGPIYREEVPKDKILRANMRASEGIHEPSKPHAASFGQYRAAEYIEDGAEYRTQYHDELSDSGSEVFVSVEDDEYQDDVNSIAKQNSFEDHMENHPSDSNLRARSLRATKETRLNRERSFKASKDNSLNSKESLSREDDRPEEYYAHRNKWAQERSFKPRKDNPSNEPRVANNVPTVEKIVHRAAYLASDISEGEDAFPLEAKAIAEEAARLALLNYVKYSRSGSASMDLDDLTDNTSESMREKSTYSKTNKSNYDEDDDQHVGIRRDSNKKKYNRPSDTLSRYRKDHKSGMEYKSDESDEEADELSSKAASNADVHFARRRGDEEATDQVRVSKPKSPSLSVKREKKASSPTYTHGKHSRGKSAGGPTFDQVTYRKDQQASQKPYDAGPGSEKRPIFDDRKPDFYFDNVERYKYSQEMANQRQPHQPLSKLKAKNNSYHDHEPYLDEEAREELPLYANQMSHGRDRRPMKETHRPHQHEYESHQTIIGVKTAGHSRNSSSSSLRGRPDAEDDVQDRTQLKKTDADPNANRDQFISKRTARSPAKFAQQQQMTHEDSDEDEHYANYRAWNAGSPHNRENSMRARPQIDNDKWKAKRADEHAMNPREQMPVDEQDTVPYERNHVEKAQGTNSYNIIRQPVRSSRQQIASKEEKGEAREQGQVGSSMPSSSSKIKHQKKNFDDELSAKWHGTDDVFSAEATQHDMMKNIQSFQSKPSSHASMEGSHNTQNKFQEPATRIKPHDQDNYMGKRTPLRQEHHEKELDSMSSYKPHNQVDDSMRRRPSNPMSVQPQSSSEDCQVTASSNKPYAHHDSVGRRTGQLQKQEEQKSPSNNNVRDQQHRQGKNQSEQDPWLERNWPQNRYEHQEPTSTQGAANIAPSPRHEPPTRKPPPLPQKNASIFDRSNYPGASQGQQNSHSPSPQKQEEEGAYGRNNSATQPKRTQPPTRPPPQVIANIPTVNDRESPARIDKEESRLQPPTRQPPAAPTRRTSSDPVISATKPPEASSPLSVSAPNKLASSTSVGASPASTPKKAPKLPHVDDIAANLEALRQAKLAQLKGKR